MGCK